MTPTTDDVDRGEEQARAHNAKRERVYTVIVVVVGIVLAVVLVVIWR